MFALAVSPLNIHFCVVLTRARFSAETLLSSDRLEAKDSEGAEPSESATVKLHTRSKSPAGKWWRSRVFWVWVYQPMCSCKGQLPGRTVRTAESVKIQGDSNSVISLSDEVTRCVMHISAGLTLMSAGRVAWAAPLSVRQSVSSSSL